MFSVVVSVVGGGLAWGLWPRGGLGEGLASFAIGPLQTERGLAQIRSTRGIKIGHRRFCRSLPC